MRYCRFSDAEFRKSLKRTVEPTLLPVDLETFKRHIRVDHDHEDDLIEGYIRAATEKFETDTERALMPQTWLLTMDEFPWDAIELRVLPVTAISAVNYIDDAGASQTLATSVYTYSLNEQPVRISLKKDQVWPVTINQQSSVSVTFTAGYSTALQVPESAKQAIRMLAGHWFNYREAVGDRGVEVPLGYDALVERLHWRGYR